MPYLDPAKNAACKRAYEERMKHSEEGRVAARKKVLAYKKRHPERAQAQNKAYKRKNPEWRLYWSAKVSAASRGREFDLEITDFVIPTHCPVFGFEMHPGDGARTDASPSVDRIDNTRGYVKGNIQIISWRANRLKCDATADELQKLVDYMRREK